jgi:acetyl esterase
MPNIRWNHPIHTRRFAMAFPELDPQVVALLQEREEQDVPPLSTLTPVEARAQRNPAFIALGGPPGHIEKVENLIIPGPAGDLPMRVYTPDGSGSFPVLVYFHGGGWVICNLDTHDSLCRALANAASCVVASVDYRLAPEHTFPAAAEDAYAATQWVADNGPQIHVDPTRIAVGGDSAGGNLAAVVSLMARDKKGPSLQYQVLIYPVVNLSSFDTNSYREHGEGYILTRDSMEYYQGHYLRNKEDGENTYASPLLAEDLQGLPPALVIAAEIDVLTDEAEAYANRLKEAGVPVTYSCYKGMIHPFLSLAGVVDRAKDGIDEIARALCAAFIK